MGGVDAGGNTMDRSLLIVDDSLGCRKVIRKTLRLAGIDDAHIREADNGQTALDAMRGCPASLVLLDINMPVMSGVEFVTELRRTDLGAHTHIIVISTESNRDRLAELRSLGVSDSLPKPFEPEQIRAFVVRIFGEAA